MLRQSKGITKAGKQKGLEDYRSGLISEVWEQANYLPNLCLVCINVDLGDHVQQIISATFLNYLTSVTSELIILRRWFLLENVANFLSGDMEPFMDHILEDPGMEFDFHICIK